MKRRLHKFFRIALLVGVILSLCLVCVQLLLNSNVTRDKIEALVSPGIDGTLDFKDYHISVFPGVRLKIDSLSITYPHVRFASCPHRGEFASEGCGVIADTLARADGIILKVSPLELIAGKIKIDKVSFQGLSVFAHSYGPDGANWQMFASSDSKDTSSVSLPAIKLSSFEIGDGSRLVFTDRSSQLGLSLSLDDLSCEGLFKLSDDGFSLRKARLQTVSLASLDLKDTPCFDVPLKMDVKASAHRKGESLSMRVPRLDLMVAGVPLLANGVVDMRSDSTFVKARASIDSLDVQPLLREYGILFSDILPYVQTDAKIQLDLLTDGYMPQGKLPPLEATVRIPKAGVKYAPRSIDGSISLEGKLSTDEGHHLNARLDNLRLTVPGAGLNASGYLGNLTSGNPSIKAKASLDAVMEKLTRDFLHDAGVDAAGNVNLELEADAHLSDFDKMHFNEANLTGHLSSEKFALNLQSDSINLRTYRPDVDLTSAPDGLTIHVVADSAYAKMASKLSARGREMDCDLKIGKRQVGESQVSYSDLKVKANRLFAMSGVHKMGVNDANVQIESWKNDGAEAAPKPHAHHHHTIPDSLRRRMHYNAAGIPVGPSGIPVLPPDNRVIRIRLDSAILASFKAFEARGKVEIGKGFVASPVFPLRTRLDGVNLAFSQNSFNIDTLSLRSGTSDVSIKGYIQGLDRYKKKRGSLRTKLDVNSNRLNVNEIVAAIQNGSKSPSDTTVSGESDERFVLDSLANAPLKEKQGKSTEQKRVFLPPFVDATLNFNTSTLNLSDFNLSPLRIKAHLQNGVLQVSDAFSDAGIGRVSLNGYYSTKDINDISAGLDLQINDASANGILQMLPSFDSLMPPLRSFKGVLDCQLSATAQMDDELNVDMSSLDGMVRISGKDLSISDAGDLRRFTKLLLFKNRDIGTIDDMEVSAVARGGNLEVFPFILNVDRYKVALQGIQGFDGSIDYYVSVLKSPFLIPFGLKFYGTLKKWRLGLGFSKYPTENVPVFTSQLDSVKINVARSIQNIYSGGLDEVRRYNMRNRIGLEREKIPAVFHDSTGFVPLSEQDKARFDSLGIRTSGKAATDSLSATSFYVDRLEEEIRKTKFRTGKHRDDSR